MSNFLYFDYFLTIFLVIYLPETIANKRDKDGLSTICLGCLCEASTKCDRTLKCEDKFCGPFRISKDYWTDAGKPTLPGEELDAEKDDESQITLLAFKNCVIDPFCAARTVQGYMMKLRKDCNGDKKIDCTDYALMHTIGGYVCKGELIDPFKRRFEKCMAQVLQISYEQKKIEKSQNSPQIIDLKNSEIR